MANKTNTANTKRLPKGQRTHARRLKQAARNEIGTNNPQSNPVQSKPVSKKQPQAKVID